MLNLFLCAAEQPPDWAHEVRPILAKHCLQCHGADPAVRQAKLRVDDRAFLLEREVIDTENPAASELLARVRAHDEDRMPPPEAGRPLNDEELAVLARWVQAGAPVDNHWAFQQPRAPIPPMLDELDSWPRQPLDAFVAEGLEAGKIEPTREAPREQLLRRASLDIRGLPLSPEELQVFLSDDSEAAYENAIDRLLESPHYGEYWAARWLDLARYADTQGYEQDQTRTIWPWRDWVIDAYNSDMPYDEFTVRQLAGDLLPGATDADVLATAFNRNTMTNSEGGTRDEEFRVAAIVDRVNTTYQSWMGLTMNCAQCHAHKYDPISQEEYYASFALLNQTADTDRNDDAPRLDWTTPRQRAKAEALSAGMRSLTRELLAVAASRPPTPSGSWVDDGIPPGAIPQGEDAKSGWPWRSEASTPPVKPFSGWRASESNAPAQAFAQHFFDNSAEPIQLAENEKIIVHAMLDPGMLPEMIMVQVHTPTTLWEHRAYWGISKGTWGTDGTHARFPMGELPQAGTWVRLEVDAATIGLPAGTIVDGIALSQYGGANGGRVWWDAIGFESDGTRTHAWQDDRAAWETRLASVNARGTSPETAEALRTDSTARTKDQDRLLEVEWRHATGTLGEATVRYETARTELTAARMQSVSTPVMRALPENARRPTHLLTRGAWNDPAEEVAPGIPAALRAPGTIDPLDRLAFAMWIASEENPLTARVQVNRIWESLFGRGIVETSEDFGTQGALPANQALLDHLAIRFVELGWSQKALLKEILTSATYRQDSAVSPELLERDPYNVLLARGPRFRLGAETIRDQALAIGGLLDRTLHGPPVFPAQPASTWQVVYNGATWTESPAGDRHRRGLYTFWRRTSPYPSMMTFDAPSREFCVSRRIRTNTPLQALVVLNDPVYLEASAGLGRLMRTAGKDDRSRIAAGFKRATGREIDPQELATLETLLVDARARFASDPESATLFLQECRASDDGEPVECAAWIVLGNVLLNLDEVLVKS
jgi:hypothetical protein